MPAYTPNQWPVLITQGRLLQHIELPDINVFTSTKSQINITADHLKFRTHFEVGLAIGVLVQCGSERDDVPRADEAPAPLNNLRAVEVLPEKEDPWCSLHSYRQFPCIRIIYNGLHHAVNKTQHLRESAIIFVIAFWQ